MGVGTPGSMRQYVSGLCAAALAGRVGDLYRQAGTAAEPGAATE
ncbi:MAG TPA: hypothetical protein VGH88_02045 [Streptosporangiaceae bacterium]